MCAQLLAKLNPADTIRARVGARIPLNTGADPLQPVEAGPKYPQPMYAPLVQLSADWMLPGISNVEPDCGAAGDQCQVHRGVHGRPE